MIIVSENDWHWWQGRVGGSNEQDQVKLSTSILMKFSFDTVWICCVSWFKWKRHLNMGQWMFCWENSLESKGKQIIYHRCQVSWHHVSGRNIHLIWFILYGISYTQICNILHADNVRSRKPRKSNNLSLASVFGKALRAWSNPCSSYPI